VPSAVAYDTPTATVVGCDRLTLNVAGLLPSSPSGLTLASPTLTAGTTTAGGAASSSVIVPVPLPSMSDPPVGLESASVNVSSASSSVSPLTATSTVLVVWPELNVTVVSGTVVGPGRGRPRGGRVVDAGRAAGVARARSAAGLVEYAG
jgi:hypothetical protein